MKFSDLCTQCGECCKANAVTQGLPDRGDCVCVHYDDESRLCKIYEDRPPICRIDPQLTGVMTLLAQVALCNQSVTSAGLGDEYLVRLPGRPKL